MIWFSIVWLSIVHPTTRKYRLLQLMTIPLLLDIDMLFFFFVLKRAMALEIELDMW